MAAHASEPWSADTKTGKTTAEPYRVTEDYFERPRKLRIIIIGCGASGILFAYKFQKHLTDCEIVIYEKNEDVGGTWLENRYPGCACDVPSHAYQYPWAPNPEWKKYYSGSEELCQYFKGVAERFNIMQYVKLRHRIVGASWNEEVSKWHVKVQNGDNVFEDDAEFLLNAGGVLNDWKWPSIPGLENFQGKLMHSAKWDDSYDLRDKNIAIIGGGSSAVQIIPSLQPRVKSMTTFIRSSAWISGSYGATYAGPNGQNFEYSQEQIEQFRQNPKLQLEYWKKIEQELNKRFRFIIKGSEDQKQIVKNTAEDMRAKLAQKPSLADHLIPKFAFGCRRPTPGNGYLEALTSDNVDPVFTPIEEVTSTGLRTTDGHHYEVDALVCATGFNVSFRPRFPLIGLEGENLQDRWTKNTPKSYLSMMVDGFPNYFTSLGPHSPVGHGSIIPVIEVVADYILAVMKKVQCQSIRSVDVKREAVEDFSHHADEFLKRTAWSDGCSSWFKNGTVDGPVVAIWPGSRLNWFEALREPRYEDFNYKYATGNRFQYFGNGFTQREIEGSDLTWYLDSPDV
ncbi:cyclohexanone monooxygenase [Annulohypoxylon bovei var. microspora]|nr:cyclohexanone monooxygenase [Annulohypoxylon bovei var. microspora]